MLGLPTQSGGSGDAGRCGSGSMGQCGDDAKRTSVAAKVVLEWFWVQFFFFGKHD